MSRSLNKNDKTIAQVTQEFLHFLGYQTLVAHNGQDAMQILTEHKDEINLVLLDMNLPDINGREVALKLKKGRPALKVILTSELNLIADDFQGITKAVLRKPYTLKEISDMVSRTLCTQDGS